MQGIVLEYKMKKGQVYNYSVVMTNDRYMKDEENEIRENITMKLKMVQRVKNVTPDNTFELEIDVTPESLTRDGSAVEIPLEPQKVLMKMDKHGNVLYSSVHTPSTTTTFPKNPINIGDSWTGESKVSIPEINKEVKLLFTYTASSIANVNGYECVKIDVEGKPSSLEVEGITQTFETKGVTYFAYKDGMLVKSDVTTKIKATAGDAMMTHDLKVSVELEKLEMSSMPSAGVGGEEFLISG